MQFYNNLKKRDSKPLAIWHWSNFAMIVLLLLSVLLVKTIFSSKSNTPMLQVALEKKGLFINTEQAKFIAKFYTKKIWDWHVYFGYVLTALLLFRILFEWYRKDENTLRKEIAIAKTQLKLKLPDKKSTRHFLLIKITYCVFYVTLILMVASGLFIKFSSNYSNLKNIRGFIKDIHNVGMYLVLGFIIVHLLGLIIFEVSQQKQID